MTIHLSRRHWIIAALLLFLQLPGLYVEAQRGVLIRDGWIRLGLIAVPHRLFGWIIGVTAVAVMCFATAVIVRSLWDALTTAVKH